MLSYYAKNPEPLCLISILVMILAGGVSGFHCVGLSLSFYMIS